MHDYLALDERQFEELVVAADEYVRAAHARMLADYFVIALNGGPKSASSVAHAHLQVVGRRSRHFAYPERIVHSCPPDYWYDAGAAHERMGLGVAAGSSSGFANVCPTKEADFTVLSRSVVQSAPHVWALVRSLVARGTTSFSLAAIISPNHLSRATVDIRYANWPPVVWRFIDRGDVRGPQADIGTLELFGSTIVATDPYRVADALTGGCLQEA